MCLALVASFFAINKAIEGKIKEGLVKSLHRDEVESAKTDSERNERNIRLLSVLTESAGLKAGIGLLREGSFNEKEQLQVQKTLEAQLREVGGVLAYDLLLLFDATGRPITGFVGKDIGEVPLESISTALHPLISAQGTFYEATTVPINLGGEKLGSLTLGKKFDLSSWNNIGHAALVHDQKIILTTFPNESVEEVERQLQTRCANAAASCEIKVGRETYLTLLVQRPNFGKNIQLFSFQSIDAARKEFTGGLRRIFLLIAAGGLLGVLLLSAISSRSISKPITGLIHQLRESERTGLLHADFQMNAPVKEVNLLAGALNQAAGAVRESQERLEEAILQFIATMAQALDARDRNTAGHSDRVSANSTAIAEAMGVPPDQIELIRVGAKLHDVGKIGVPDAVLQKPGRLTEEEFDLIKRHPQIGKKILEGVTWFKDYLPIVELHHENHDGTGYPYGLKGEEIPLGVRIVHVADVYDAITSDRTYRKAMSEDQVWEILKQGSGKQFDPGVVAVFLSLLRQRKKLEEVFQEASDLETERILTTNSGRV